MDLRLCPSCGQSVLDDDAQTCPFCGAAMDGSDKGRKPPSGRGPGAKPAASRSASGDGAPRSAPPEKSAKSEARPVQAGMRAPRTLSDDDDPFGIGVSATAGEFIQALAKPEKGRLHRVVCPMCEHAGFIAKSAIGKQVRCANEKCMVPVFIAPDPDAPPVERAPRRRATADAAAETRAVGSSTPRNKLIVYGVAGVVLLGLTIGLVQFLNQPPAASPDLSQPAPRIAGGAVADPEAEAAAAPAAAAAQQSAAQHEPGEIAGRLAKRMIQSARLPSNRDKALARRMTGDIYLRLEQPAEAAQEFSQLLAVNRQAAYYQVEPRLASYWRHRHSGDLAAAKSDFELLRREAATIPAQGRPALEAALGLAAALVAEGGLPAAAEMVQKQQKDATIVANSDGLKSGVWFFTAARLRDIGRLPFAAADVYAWHDPLLTAVAADLACHRQWGAAIAWIQNHPGKRESGDSLAVLAEIASSAGASDEDLARIETAAGAAHPQIGLRVRSVIAAERRNAAALESIGTAWSAMPPLQPMSLPSMTEILQLNLPDLQEMRLITDGLTEYARAAVLCGDNARAEDAIRLLTRRFQATAPATAEIRGLALEFDGKENQIRKRISDELRVSSDADIASAFRNYHRKVDSLTAAAEDRRLALFRSLSRIIRAGGISSLQAVLEDSESGLRPEIFVDESVGLLFAAAVQGGLEFPAAENNVPELRVAVPARSAEIQEIRVAPLIVQAWLLTRQGRPGDAAVRLETASTDLPGLREVVLNEIMQYAAARVTQPAPVYNAVGKLRNSGWRERILEAVSRQMAARGFEKQCEEWIESQTSMPGTEEVMAFYGLARALIERQQTAAATSPAKPSSL